MKYIKLYTAALLLAAMLFSSCKKLIDSDAKDVLEAKDMYQTVFDADAAVIGLYGKFMNLAERYVVLNELRADLMTVTPGSNDYLKQLSIHDVKTDNPYIDPKPFYEVILNCNDVMRNFDIMLRDKKLKVLDYNMRYSDVASLRSWIYLQLGIQFGKIPYVTSDLANVEALTSVMSSPAYQPIAFSALLDSLIKVQEALPYQQTYPAGSSLMTTVDGYTTNKFFINKQVMLGQLYLWRGKGSDFHNAALAFKSVMETAPTGDFFTYRVTGASKADNNDIAISYVRYKEPDEGSLIDNNSQGWRSLFARSEDKLFGYEWIWYLPYNKAFKPVDPFINLFSNQGGSYLVKPSQSAIDDWNSQKQKNDIAYDARGTRFTYRTLNGQPVIMKYLYNYLDEKTFTPTNVFEKNGRWYLYRAASLHLDYAEAANRDGHRAIANALINQGIQTTLGNKLTNEGDAYVFDARKSDNPRIAADWYLNAGIRGRANLYSVPIPANATATSDSTLAIENMVVGETGLELAYEGRRWADLMRIALRRGEPAFLADRIYNKLRKEGNPAAETVRSKLMNKDNWYLPFKW